MDSDQQLPVTFNGESCAAYDGYIFCVGGNSGSSAQNSDAVYYAPLSSTGIGAWANTTNYPYGIDGAKCEISTAYIYCVGGELSVDATPVGSVNFAQVSASGVGTWQTTKNYPIVISGGNCLASADYIYCVGGSGSTSETNDAYYAPTSSSGVGTWTETTSYPTYPDGYTLSPSCVTANDYAYCIGGDTNSSDLNNAQPVYYATLSSSGIGAWTSTTAIPEYQGNCMTANNYVYCFYGNNYAYFTQITPPSSTSSSTSTSNTSSSPSSSTIFSSNTSSSSLASQSSTLSLSTSSSSLAASSSSSAPRSATTTVTTTETATATSSSTSSSPSSSTSLPAQFLVVMAPIAALIGAGAALGIHKRGPHPSVARVLAMIYTTRTPPHTRNPPTPIATRPASERQRPRHYILLQLIVHGTQPYPFV